jgi:hypothetical protein
VAVAVFQTAFTHRKSHQADSIRFPYFLGGRRRKSLGCGRVDMKKKHFWGFFLVRAAWKPSRAFFYFLGLQTTLAGIDDSGDRAGGIGASEMGVPGWFFSFRQIYWCVPGDGHINGRKVRPMMMKVALALSQKQAKRPWLTWHRYWRPMRQSVGSRTINRPMVAQPMLQPMPM